MCGILFVQSRTARPLAQHLAALDILSSRGPDFVRYQHNDHVFIAQSVLHITGNKDFYNQTRSDFFAYNGEIYNYRWHGRYGNDVELVYQSAKNNYARFKYFEGPWAWVYWNGQQVSYATDPQGEHYLYRYQDDDIVVVCSEVAPIMTYVQTMAHIEPYKNKHWTLQQQTPWLGIERLEPGRLYVDHQACTELDSIWSWIKPQPYPNITAAQEEFNSLWNRVMRDMTPACASAISFSGGVDSSLILSESPDSELVATNMADKDPIVDRITDFLTAQQQQQVTVINVTAQQWAQYFKAVLHRTKMPVQSWSFVGKWIVAQHAKSRVIFSGIAADELFGGYEIYDTIQYDQNCSHSPYSKHSDADLWRRCLHVYDGDAYAATLLADYLAQIVGCDAPGQDRIAGAWGKEVRNPFMNKRIMQFALNLPSQYRRGKPLLKTRFLQKYDHCLLMPKKGFTGHANDALPWLDIQVSLTGNRYLDWQVINQQMFANFVVDQTKTL